MGRTPPGHELSMKSPLWAQLHQILAEHLSPVEKMTLAVTDAPPGKNRLFDELLEFGLSRRRFWSLLKNIPPAQGQSVSVPGRLGLLRPRPFLH